MVVRIFVVVICLVMQGCALPKYRAEKQVYNPTGMDKEKLATVVCRHDSKYTWAWISSVYNSDGVEAVRGIGCNEDLDFGHQFAPGDYLFAVTCRDGNHEGYVRARARLSPSKNYKISCVLENKPGPLGAELYDKVRLEIKEFDLDG